MFEDTETGAPFVEAMRQVLDRKGQQHTTFRKELRTVYDIDTIFEDLFALSDGCAEPQGTLAKLIGEIDRKKQR